MSIPCRSCEVWTPRLPRTPSASSRCFVLVKRVVPVKPRINNSEQKFVRICWNAGGVCDPRLVLWGPMGRSLSPDRETDSSRRISASSCLRPRNCQFGGKVARLAARTRCRWSTARCPARKSTVTRCSEGLPPLSGRCRAPWRSRSLLPAACTALLRSR